MKIPAVLPFLLMTVALAVLLAACTSEPTAGPTVTPDAGPTSGPATEPTDIVPTATILAEPTGIPLHEEFPPPAMPSPRLSAPLPTATRTSMPIPTATPTPEPTPTPPPSPTSTATLTLSSRFKNACKSGAFLDLRSDSGWIGRATADGLLVEGLDVDLDTGELGWVTDTTTGMSFEHYGHHEGYGPIGRSRGFVVGTSGGDGCITVTKGHTIQLVPSRYMWGSQLEECEKLGASNDLGPGFHLVPQNPIVCVYDILAAPIEQDGGKVLQYVRHIPEQE